MVMAVLDEDLRAIESYYSSGNSDEVLIIAVLNLVQEVRNLRKQLAAERGLILVPIPASWTAEMTADFYKWLDAFLNIKDRAMASGAEPL